MYTDENLKYLEHHIQNFHMNCFIIQEPKKTEKRQIPQLKTSHFVVGHSTNFRNRGLKAIPFFSLFSVVRTTQISAFSKKINT